MDRQVATMIKGNDSKKSTTTKRGSIENIVLQNNENKKTVYLVDDDQDDRAFGYNALTKIDCVKEVVPTKNADDLFDCLEEFGIYQDFLHTQKDTPIILLDIHMPGTNGIEALKKIRNHPITSEFHVIILTADNSCEAVYDAYRLKANGYLQKPFDASEFNQVIKSINSQCKKMNFGSGKLLN